MGKGNELILAGETLDRLAMQFEGMVSAAKALKGIGSIENHLEELTKKRDELMKDLERITRDNEDAHDALEATQSKIEHEKDQAGLFAAAQKAIAQAEADEIITRANATAAAVKAEADEAAASTMAKANEGADEAFQHLQFLLVAQERAIADTAAIETKRDESQAKYDKIQEAIKAIAGG